MLGNHLFIWGFGSIKAQKCIINTSICYNILYRHRIQWLEYFHWTVLLSSIQSFYLPLFDVILASFISSFSILSPMLELLPNNELLLTFFKSSLWNFTTCLRKFSLPLNWAGHAQHLKCFLSVCTIMWYFSLYLSRNCLPQIYLNLI